MVNFLGCNLLDSVIIPSMRDSRYKFAWCILGFSHVEFGYRHLRSFQRYSHALLKVFFPSVILLTYFYIFVTLRSTPIVKIEDASLINTAVWQEKAFQCRKNIRSETVKGHTNVLLKGIFVKIVRTWKYFKWIIEKLLKSAFFRGIGPSPLAHSAERPADNPRPCVYSSHKP